MIVQEKLSQSNGLTPDAIGGVALLGAGDRVSEAVAATKPWDVGHDLLIGFGLVDAAGIKYAQQNEQ